MVNFNSESMMATPPKNVVDIIILQYWYDCIEAFKDYRKSNDDLKLYKIDIIHSYLYALFECIEENLMHENVDLQFIKGLIETKDFSKMTEAYRLLRIFLTQKGLTNAFTKKQLHGSNIVQRNIDNLKGDITYG